MREVSACFVFALLCLAVNARERSNLRTLSERLNSSANEIDYTNSDANADSSTTRRTTQTQMLTSTEMPTPMSYGRILRPDEFERFANSLQLVLEQQCKRDLNVTLWGIVNQAHWAILMYDASAKGPTGVEYGQVFEFGNYDECVDVNKHVVADLDHVPVRAKYCLADVTIEGMVLQNVATRRKLGNSTIAHMGMCVPASCDIQDVGIFLGNYLQKSVTIDEKTCQAEREFHITKGMTIYACIVMFFITMAFLSTFYHIHQIVANRHSDKKPSYGAFDTALKSFSIIENLKKIGQTSKDQMGLNAINGIKSIAMLLILAGHALSFIGNAGISNNDFITESLRKVHNAFVSNSLLFVDVFLFLSGFLFCRILLIELERRRGKINVLVLYVGRYVRLTPSYMAVLGFYMTWLTSIGSGPRWASKVDLEEERCRESWWLNILYINNYVGTDTVCMFQSWYLSVDSQLFVLAPLVIYLLNRSRKQGLNFLLFLLVLCIVVPFYITYNDKLDPTLMAYLDEIQDITTNPYFVKSYIKTHMRATDYIIGLLVGYIVHVMQERGTRIPKYLTRIFWVFSIIIGGTSMFSITTFYVRSYTDLESALYSSLHKVGWGVSIAWLVIAVTTGHAATLQKILSNRVFGPISRLTYSAYLCNGIVELYHFGETRNPVYMTTLDSINRTLMHSANTFALALIVCLLFESPIHALERIALRSAKPAQSKTNNSTPSTSEEQIA